MDWLWYVVAIVITLGVFYFKLRRQVEFKRKIPLIAEMLGLRYSDRADQLPERIAQEKDISLDPENVRTVQKYARIMSSWWVDGEFNRVKVVIRPHIVSYGRNDRSVYTRVEALFTESLNLGMMISNRGNAPLGKVEIHVESLDRDIIVTGSEEIQVRNLISNADVHNALSAAFKFSSQVIIDDTGVRLDKLGTPLDTDYYRNALDLLTRIIFVFEKAHR